MNEKLINAPSFLKDGENVDILFHAEEELPLILEIPMHIISKVVYTEPGVKGDTATNAMKPAKIESGAEIKVPLFINEGEIIKVDTRKGIYVERVKN
mgnify:CR=1 FL=1